MAGATMPIVRVAVLADSRLTEMALPAELPLREILPAVQRLVVPAEQNGDPSDPASDAALQSLAPIGGAPFSLDASLDTVGVVDGDLLALQSVPVGPAAPGIVEDIADAAMIFSTSRRNPWATAHIQRYALAAVITVVMLGTGLSATYRAVTAELAPLLAVSGIAAFTGLAALLLVSRWARTAILLAMVALLPMLAAAGVTAWSLITLIVPSVERERVVSVFTATAVVGFGVLLAAGAELLWQLPILTVGCGLIVAALLLTIQTPQLSALWARLPLPVIPAPGDPTPSAPSARVLQDLPRRVQVSDAHQNGFIAAAVLLSVLGSVAIAWRPEVVSGLGWYVVAATAAAAMLRARVWDSAACKTWLLAQPYLVAGILLVLYAATGQYVAAFSAVLILTVLTLAWVVVALNPHIASPDSYALPVRRLLGFVTVGLDASLIPVMAYLVGLFTWVLNR